MTPRLDEALEERLARFVEHHVLHGERLPLEPLCADRPELVGPLRALVDQYLSLTSSLSGGSLDPAGAVKADGDVKADGRRQRVAESAPPALPAFDGFHLACLAQLLAGRRYAGHGRDGRLFPEQYVE